MLTCVDSAMIQQELAEPPRKGVILLQLYTVLMAVRKCGFYVDIVMAFSQIEL